MTTLGPLNTAFEAYLKLPTFSNLSDRQHKELKRAYFGGAQTLLAALQGSTPAMVQTLCVEIEMHFQDVEAGRA